MTTIIYEGTEYRFFDHIYAVSHCGKVLRYLVPYKPKIRPSGYADAGNGKLIHRMVAICWIDNPCNAKHVHHRDHDKTNNHTENLEWITPKKHSAQHPRKKWHHTDETKEKLRQSRLGTKQSEATKQKKRVASLLAGNRPPSWAGKQHSEATKAKMSLNHPRCTRCRVFGTEYPSFSVAGKALSIRPLTLRKRCLSKNFHEYELL